MSKIKINTKYKAKSISYGGNRDLNNVYFIVIHYTAGNGDTAEADARYFATGNTRTAGAHFFVDKAGKIYQSIAMNKIAWSVGGDKYSDCAKTGGGKFYGQCTNTNSVSIELCDCMKDTNYEQLLATRELVQYIQKKCPNAKHIIRHFDVTGKYCPAPMMGKNNAKWNRVHDFLIGKYEFTAKVIKPTKIKMKPKNLAKTVGKLKPKQAIKVIKEQGNWGQINYQGNTYWIKLHNIKMV